MKVKRLLALILVFTLFSAITVFAVTDYKKYTAKKISVKVNGATLDSGLLVDIYKDDLDVETRVETPMVNLDEFVKAFGGIVSKDNNSVIYRPNVQMAVASPEDAKSIRVVEKGESEKKVPFVVVAFMDNIQTDISNIKITVVDPFGDEILSSVEPPLAKKDQDSEVYVFNSKILEFKAKWTGKYFVNLQMKEVGGSKFYRVGQYAIYFKSE